MNETAAPTEATSAKLKAIALALQGNAALEYRFHQQARAENRLRKADQRSIATATRLARAAYQAARTAGAFS